MENASKAMIMVASFVIAVMVLSIMVYLFVQAGRVPAQFEYTKQAEDVAAFNAKFEKYIVKAEIDGSNEIIVPSNNFADVITVCNLAYDINCKNDNDKTNSVIVEFKINEKDYCIFPKIDGNGNTVLEKGKVFECASNNESAMIDKAMVDIYSLMEADNGGKKITDLKSDPQGRLRYRYYFDCEADYGFSDLTNDFENDGKILKMTFTLIENMKYDSY